jgi:hypothetical protein
VLAGLLTIAAVVGPAPLGAQAAGAVPSDSACTYEQCALSIAPVWNGLAVVRGAAAERVANLGFFWAGPLLRAFPGADSAAWYGARAVHVRRTAAVLTDVGGLLVVYALGRRVGSERLSRDAQVALAAGAAAVAVSVPLHFVADGHLSRAVWWHNRRYAR